MSNPNEEQDARPSRADVDDVADAAIGVDTRIFRTLWDTFLFTPRVVEAAFAGDREKYVPIIRLFLVLFGAQFAIMAFADLPAGFSLQALETSDDTRAAVVIWLEQGRDCQTLMGALPTDASTSPEDLAELRSQAFQACRAEVELTLERLSSLTMMPLTFLSTLPFLMLLKFYAWRRSFFGHLLAYLAATNSSYVLMTPLLALMFVGLGQAYFYGAMGIGTLWYFFAMGRILFRYYSPNPFVVGLQLLGQLIALPVMLLIIIIAQFLIVDATLSAFHDLSIWQLFMIDAGITPEDVS